MSDLPNNYEIMDELRRMRQEQANMFCALLAATLRGSFPGLSDADIKEITVEAMNECRVR